MRLRSLTTRMATNFLAEAMMPPQPDDPQEVRDSEKKQRELWAKGAHAQGKDEYIRYSSIVGLPVKKRIIQTFDKLIKLDSILAMHVQKKEWAKTKIVYLQIKEIRNENPDPKMIEKLEKLAGGIVDESLLKENLTSKLNSAIKKIQSDGSMWKKVKQGSINSPEVATIQKALTQLGFPAGKADGWFGKTTAKAVMAFQKSKGLKVDGDPGPNTLKAMINAVGGRGKEYEKPGERQAYLDKNKAKADAAANDKYQNDKIDDIANKSDAEAKAKADADKKALDTTPKKPVAEFKSLATALVNGDDLKKGDMVLIDGREAYVDSYGGQVFFLNKDGTPFDDRETKPVADFKGAKTPDEVIKIATDALADITDDADNIDIDAVATVIKAAEANMPSIATPVQKAETSKKIIAMVDTAELNNPQVKAALAKPQMAVDVADAKDEDEIEEALRKFVRSVFPEAIPASLRGKIPADEVAKMSMRTIVKQAQEEGLMSAFVDPSRATNIIQDEIKKITSNTSNDSSTNSVEEPTSNEYDPKKELQSLTLEQSKEAIRELIKADRYIDALAAIEYDKRITLPKKDYDALVTLASEEALGKNESLEEKQIWARSGQKVVRKYRCTAGIRKGRIVAQMAQCFAAPDLKKRFSLKRTKARLGGRMVRKAKRTKRVNPASRRVQALNKGK